jgi:hypothetical protein
MGWYSASADRTGALDSALAEARSGLNGKGRPERCQSGDGVGVGADQLGHLSTVVGATSPPLDTAVTGSRTAPPRVAHPTVASATTHTASVTATRVRRITSSATQRMTHGSGCWFHRYALRRRDDAFMTQQPYGCDHMCGYVGLK